jgi:hypothetical protein
MRVMRLVKRGETMERVKTYKVQPTAQGVVLTVNGVSYQLGGSTDAIRFELRAAQEQATLMARQAAERANRQAASQAALEKWAQDGPTAATGGGLTR